MNGHVTTRPLAWVLANYRDGDEHGWDTEFRFLRIKHATRVNDLINQIRAHGIRKPIHLGPDGRVWDGHHRLCVAHLLDLKDVPVLIWAPVQVHKTGNWPFPWEAHCRLCNQKTAHHISTDQSAGVVLVNTRGVGNRTHDHTLAAAHLHLSDRHPKASA